MRIGDRDAIRKLTMTAEAQEVIFIKDDDSEVYDITANGDTMSASFQDEDEMEGRASRDGLKLFSNGAMIDATSAKAVATISLPLGKEYTSPSGFANI